jgi:universal stress protein E
MTIPPLRRIMIASDSEQGMAEALHKAGTLAAGDAEAQLRVLRASYDRIAEEPAEILPADEREALIGSIMRTEQEALAALTEPLQSRVRNVTAELLWRKDAAPAIAEAATAWHAQLLVKPVSHHGLGDFLHTPLDWALMRQAPCPVLVSRGAWGDPAGCVLAAVDIGDREHEALCGEILRRACQLGGILGVDVHVASAYPNLGQSVNELQIATDFQGIKASMRDSRQRALNAMLESLELRVTETHLLEGKAVHVIPALARRLGASLTVLGTAARRGVSKLIIGNTAEDLISRMECDLLTVRAPWS